MTSAAFLNVVTRLQLAETAPLDFVHFVPPTQARSRTIWQLLLPQKIAERVHAFSVATFVEGADNFDCKSFLGFVMGWNSTLTHDITRTYFGDYVGASDVQNGRPYLVARKDRGITPHALLGIKPPGENPAMSLSVAGPEGPLTITDNARLLKAYGGRALLAVERMEDLQA